MKVIKLNLHQAPVIVRSLQILSHLFFTTPLPQHALGDVIILVLQIRKLKFRKFKIVALGGRVFLAQYKSPMRLVELK